MSRSAQLRLMSDINQINTDPVDGITAGPVDDNDMYNWIATIMGPENTPFEGGIFKIALQFTDEYPVKPPRVRFLSEMYHPNIYKDGGLCLDILQKMWSPILTVSLLLTSIQSLLTDPNTSSPANPEAARMLEKDYVQYKKIVRKCVEKSQMDF
jgi:ubiquitin-conjugating enzyme E2 A